MILREFSFPRAPDQPGQARISIPFGSNPANFYVQGIAEGQSTLTVAATGFSSTLLDVSVTQPTFTVSGPSTAFLNRPAQASISFNGQAVRPGAQVSINLNSSDPTVATIDSPAIAAPGSSQAISKITSLAPGNTTISADIPDGFTVRPVDLSFNLAVSLPALPFDTSTSTYSIGRNLQAVENSFRTDSAPINLTVTSSDPSKVLLSTDPKAAGQGATTFTVKAFSSALVYIQALADSGSAALTFSAPGYNSRQVTVNFYPAAFGFGAGLLNTSQTAPAGFSVFVGPVLPPGIQVNNPQTLRGGSTPLSIAIANSRPATGSIKPSTLVFTPGDNQATATFTPAAAGSTILTIAQPPGFVTGGTYPQLVVTVN